MQRIYFPQNNCMRLSQLYLSKAARASARRQGQLLSRPIRRVAHHGVSTMWGSRRFASVPDAAPCRIEAVHVDYDPEGVLLTTPGSERVHTVTLTMDIACSAEGFRVLVGTDSKVKLLVPGMLEDDVLKRTRHRRVLSVCSLEHLIVSG